MNGASEQSTAGVLRQAAGVMLQPNRPASEREIGVPNAYTTLEQSVKLLEDEVTRLSDRLHPVLRPEMPQGESLAKNQSEPVSPLSEVVHMLAAKVADVAGKLHGINERIDL